MFKNIFEFIFMDLKNPSVFHFLNKNFHLKLQNVIKNQLYVDFANSKAYNELNKNVERVKNRGRQ